jgi:hypothetical protein
MAILRYKGAPNEEPDEEETWDRQGLTLNPWNEEMSDLNIPYFVMNSTGTNLSNHAFAWAICGTLSSQPLGVACTQKERTRIFTVIRIAIRFSGNR